MQPGTSSPTIPDYMASNTTAARTEDRYAQWNNAQVPSQQIEHKV